VDDDSAVLSVIARMLADYRVTPARSAEEALSILTTHERVDLLVTDYLMPGITGDELVARARMLRPHLRVLFITAHAGAVAPVSAVFASELHVAKPVELAVLTQTVLDLIGPPLPPMTE
jgi:CheY-like chemotaxis protein